MRLFYPTFSRQQTEQLIALNRHLAELEYICLQRARHLVHDYKRLTGGMVDWRAGQDFELESYVEYYRPLTSTEELDDRQHHSGLVLRTSFMTMPPLKWYFLEPTADAARAIFSDIHFNWTEGVEDIPGLAEHRICWSFHDLHDHHNLTWADILSIERVFIDVHAVHQIIKFL